MTVHESPELDSERRRSRSLLGVRIGSDSLKTLAERSIQAIDRSAPQCVFACANPHSLVEAQHDALFMTALNQANMVVVDGVGVSFISSMLDLDLGPRITGHEYFSAVLDALAARGSGRVFFLGSSDRVLLAIRERFAQLYPALTLCGTFSPPFRPMTNEEDRQVVDLVNRARPDVLWVGMTAPKQEKWVHAHATELDVPVIGSIGAVFDFIAGTKPRAPEWMCSLGLEWVYRLAREPRRMWRRTMVSAPRFFRMVVARHVLRPR